MKKGDKVRLREDMNEESDFTRWLAGKLMTIESIDNSEDQITALIQGFKIPLEWLELVSLNGDKVAGTCEVEPVTPFKMEDIKRASELLMDIHNPIGAEKYEVIRVWDNDKSELEEHRFLTHEDKADQPWVVLAGSSVQTWINAERIEEDKGIELLVGEIDERRLIVTCVAHHQKINEIALMLNKLVQDKGGE